MLLALVDRPARVGTGVGPATVAATTAAVVAGALTACTDKAAKALARLAGVVTAVTGDVPAVTETTQASRPPPLRPLLTRMLPAVVAAVRGVRRRVTRPVVLVMMSEVGTTTVPGAGLGRTRESGARSLPRTDNNPEGRRRPTADEGPSVGAAITITVPHTALGGDSGPPGEVVGFGILDHADTRDLVAAAARNPATRWCVTVLGPDGTAVAHGCGTGSHRWPPRPVTPVACWSS